MDSLPVGAVRQMPSRRGVYLPGPRRIGWAERIARGAGAVVVAAVLVGLRGGSVLGRVAAWVGVVGLLHALALAGLGLRGVAASMPFIGRGLLFGTLTLVRGAVATGIAAVRAWRHIGAVAALAGVVLGLGAGATGEQGILAFATAERPGWAASVRAPDPGVALSPHLAGGAAVAGAEAEPRTRGAKGALLATEVARPPVRGTVVPLPGLLGEDEALPRVAFVRAEAAGEAAAVPRPAAVARAALTSMLTAYAPDRVTIEEPFLVLMSPGEAAPEPEAVPHGVSGGGLDHWWSDRPLPADIGSEKSLKCLAEAIYFEARGESATGQAAVAQVVINRVKNPAYPDDVCAVVYQNRSWFNRCQFTFACDRVRDVVRDQAAWEEAMDIAKGYASGAMWLPAVGASTHYHADYVGPRWARDMRRAAVIGRHQFYITRGGGWT